MKLNVKALCQSIGGEHKVLGDSGRCVSAASQIDKAGKESVAFCSRIKDGLQTIRSSEAGVVISSDKLDYGEEDYMDKTLILVPNPRLAFARVMKKHFQGKRNLDAIMRNNDFVYIHPGTVIGKNVIIQAGAVIGAKGIGYERNEKGEWEEFPQIGRVIIEDDVEIGSNTSIMRGALGDTIIGQGTKIGHLCSIGHGVTIGKHCFIISGSMIGGSCHVGDYSQVSLGACIKNGVKIGKNVLVGMGAVVTKNVGDGKIVFGVPAKEYGETNWHFGEE